MNVFTVWGATYGTAEMDLRALLADLLHLFRRKVRQALSGDILLDALELRACPVEYPGALETHAYFAQPR